MWLSAFTAANTAFSDPSPPVAIHNTGKAWSAKPLLSKWRRWRGRALVRLFTQANVCLSTCRTSIKGQKNNPCRLMTCQTLQEDAPVMICAFSCRYIAGTSRAERSTCSTCNHHVLRLVKKHLAT
ncbi:hypothetical protein MRB53_039446 [Persea americana]|nr:hypothetical protein MRB53_039446 [Persea americana]